MRVLLVAATADELASLSSPRGLSHDLEILITGVGMVATASHVSRALAERRPDVALNLGVCGAFTRTRPLAAVVHVVRDHCAELGVEDGPTFLPATTVGLLSPDAPPYTAGELVNAAPITTPALAALPAVTGITVNTVHGHEASIAALLARCAPDVESMEGAAFLFACLTAGVPCAQVRSVSNYVERRNRDAWQLGPAIQALGSTATDILTQL